MKQGLVILSGGQDSTTCLYWAKRMFAGGVHALTFNYGQRHILELEAARKVAQLAGVLSHEVVDLGPGILQGTSPLVSNAPLEDYPDWKNLPGGLEKTFVPGRNALFMVLAANRAYCLGLEDIVLGICQEDFGGYPDCREDFRWKMEHAINEGLDSQLKFHAPLMYLTKQQTVGLAIHLNCLEALAWTHTSYDGKYPPTGKDHASLLRAKGFELAGVPDPLVVRAWKEGLMPLPDTDNYSELRKKSVLHDR